MLEKITNINYMTKMIELHAQERCEIDYKGIINLTNLEIFITYDNDNNNKIINIERIRKCLG